jgi:hypothetical protein
VSRKHLVAVWNPVFGAEVMESHLRILLDGAAAYRKGQLAEDDVYVWWAKVRSPHRHQAMPHLADILALEVEKTRNDPGEETHLYVTDYRSLYVGHLGGITTADPRDSKTEKRHVPKYYFEKRFQLDCWFRVWDFRRLVFDDTVSVVRSLQNLRNVRYHDHPVSIYGGVVDVPLIVTETMPTRFFDHDYRSRLTDNRFWVEFDAEHSGSGSLERELRENLFGDDVWQQFDPATRVFLSTAEKIFRDHVNDPGFDLSPAIVELSKALEVTCATVLRPVIERAPVEVRREISRECDPDNWSSNPPKLSSYSNLIAGAKPVSEYLRRKLRHGQWLVESLPPILKQFAEIRNEAAHARRTERAEAVRWRRQLLGIGCDGVLAKLAMTEAVGA